MICIVILGLKLKYNDHANMIVYVVCLKDNIANGHKALSCNESSAMLS